MAGLANAATLKRKRQHEEHEQQMIWSSQSVENVVHPLMLVRSSVARDDQDCSIFHEPIKEVEVDGLPKSWEPFEHNAVTLHCGHVFHASAIALHFLTNNMSCPICRAGHPMHKMDVKCLPDSQQPLFEKYMAEYNERERQTREAEDQGRMVFVNIGELFVELRVRIQYTNAGSNVTGNETRFTPSFQTNITMFSAEDNSNTLFLATLGRSFMRRVQSLPFLPNTSGHEPCFAITHPLFGTDVITTRATNLIEVGSTIRNLEAQAGLGHDTLSMEHTLTFLGIVVGKMKFSVALKRHDVTQTDGTTRQVQAVVMRNLRLLLNRDLVGQILLARFAQYEQTRSVGYILAEADV